MRTGEELTKQRTQVINETSIRPLEFGMCCTKGSWTARGLTSW